MAPTCDNMDYFRELCLKRQAQRAGRAEIGDGSSTPVAEAVVPITVVPTPESTRPPINPKKRMKEDHGKDCGRSSRRHGERSPSGKSPRKGWVTGGSSSTGPNLQVAEGRPLHSTPMSKTLAC